MKGLAVLVLRYKEPGQREFRVPLNLQLQPGNSLGLAMITLTLVALCLINLFTKEVATVSGIAFTLIFFGVFELSEKNDQEGRRAHVELDQLMLLLAAS